MAVEQAHGAGDSPGGAGGGAVVPGAALRAELNEVGAAVRRYMFGLCGNWHEAEDLAQEALLKAWRKRESFDGRAGVRTWIFAIARNHWLDKLRYRRVRPAETGMNELAVTSDESPSPLSRAAWAEFAEAIDRAMNKLPSEQREALALRESEGLTFAQVADVLGIPPATAKSRVRYALLKLAEELKPFQRDMES